MAQKKTARGTLCSPRWDDDWVLLVEGFERKLDRQICGAEVPGGTPCMLEPAASNGRCFLHGGLPHIGGQPGNDNALRDGFYQRRLRTCSNSCPHWSSCPMASQAVQDLHPAQRPACVYERTEYDETLHNVLSGMDIDRHRRDESAPLELRFAESMAIEAAEAYALTKVLAQRAAGVLRDGSMDNALRGFGADLLEQKSGVSGAAEACLKFQREQRNWHRRLIECGEKVVAIKVELIGGGEDFDCEHEHEHDKDKDKDCRAEVRKKVRERTPRWVQELDLPGAKKTLKPERVVSLNANSVPAEDRPTNIIDAHAREMARMPAIERGKFS